MVTWNALIGGVVILIGVGLMAYGLLMILTGGMSASPAAGDLAARQGCGNMALGFVIAAASATYLVLS
jgi:hypothetical protein